MHAATIVAYTYQAESLCPTCIVDVTHSSPHGNSADRRLPSAEQHMDVLARIRGVDRNDERSFDSDDFPKVVFADNVIEGERCDRCQEELI